MTKIDITGKIDSGRIEIQRLKKEIEEIKFWSLHRCSLETQLGQAIWGVVVLKEKLDKV